MKALPLNYAQQIVYNYGLFRLTNPHTAIPVDMTTAVAGMNSTSIASLMTSSTIDGDMLQVLRHLQRIRSSPKEVRNSIQGLQTVFTTLEVAEDGNQQKDALRSVVRFVEGTTDPNDSERQPVLQLLSGYGPLSAAIVALLAAGKNSAYSKMLRYVPLDLVITGSTPTGQSSPSAELQGNMYVHRFVSLDGTSSWSTMHPTVSEIFSATRVTRVNSDAHDTGITELAKVFTSFVYGGTTHVPSGDWADKSLCSIAAALSEECIVYHSKDLVNGLSSFLDAPDGLGAIVGSISDLNRVKMFISSRYDYLAGATFLSQGAYIAILQLYAHTLFGEFSPLNLPGGGASIRTIMIEDKTLNDFLALPVPSHVAAVLGTIIRPVASAPDSLGNITYFPNGREWSQLLAQGTESSFTSVINVGIQTAQAIANCITAFMHSTMVAPYKRGSVVIKQSAMVQPPSPATFGGSQKISLVTAGIFRNGYIRTPGELFANAMLPYFPNNTGLITSLLIKEEATMDMPNVALPYTYDTTSKKELVDAGITTFDALPKTVRSGDFIAKNIPTLYLKLNGDSLFDQNTFIGKDYVDYSAVGSLIWPDAGVQTSMISSKEAISNSISLETPIQFTLPLDKDKKQVMRPKDVSVEGGSATSGLSTEDFKILAATLGVDYATLIGGKHPAVARITGAIDANTGTIQSGAWTFGARPREQAQGCYVLPPSGMYVTMVAFDVNAATRMINGTLQYTAVPSQVTVIPVYSLVSAMAGVTLASVSAASDTALVAIPKVRVDNYGRVLAWKG